MAQSPKKTALIILVLVLCCIGVIMNVVAAATEYWLVFHGTSVQTVQYNSSTLDDTHNITIDINAGLFRGQIIKCCLPTISDSFTLKDEYFHNNDFMDFGLWVSTLLFLALAVTFGCIGAVFAGINAVITPIELITGIIGLYIWNGLAGLFCFISVILWVAQYLSHLCRIAETLSYKLNIKNNKASPDFSFYLVVVASIIFVLNNLLVYLSTRRWDNKAPIDMDSGPSNGVIMLY